MKTATEPRPQRPHFVFSDDEKTALQTLQSEFDRLSELADSLTQGGLTNRYRAAHEAFAADPSNTNFAAAKQAELERFFFAEHTATKRFARAALDALLDKQVRAWAAPIVSRALDSARKYLDEVTAAEKARHKHLTGRELRHSELIEIAARGPKMIEQLWRSIEPLDPAPAKQQQSELRAALDEAHQHLEHARNSRVTAEHLARVTANYDRAHGAVVVADKESDTLRERISQQKVPAPAAIMATLTAAFDPLASVPS